MTIATFKDHPVFICGHPKSGTSLLKNLLDGHPQLVVYPEESRFFRNFLPKAGGLRLEQLIELGGQELLHIFEWDPEDPPDHQAGFPDRDYRFISFDQVRERFGDLLSKGGFRHQGDVLWAAAQAYAETIGMQPPDLAAWVEKTPYNEYFTDQIFGWWPEARCIHIVRDPRDNFASYQRKHESWTAGFFAQNWNRTTSAGFRNQTRYGKDHYWVLRYEDLVSRPEEILPEICSFIGIQDDEILRRPTRAGDLWRGNSMFEDQFDAISPAAVGRWEDSLTTQEAGLIQVVSRRLMQRLNYDLHTPVGLKTRLVGWRWQLRGLVSEARRLLWKRDQ